MSKYLICPNCKERALYLASMFHFNCEECDEEFEIEDIIEIEEPELTDHEFGDKIIY